MFLLLRLAGLLGIGVLDDWSNPARFSLATLFLVTGVAHFSRRRAGLVAIVPARLPRPELLVTITGLLELMGVVGLLVPSTRQAAAVSLGVLLVALFPANVRAAGQIGPRLLGEPSTPLLPRAVMQLVFIAGAALAAL